jgi:hypothetical protein
MVWMCQFLQKEWDAGRKMAELISKQENPHLQQGGFFLILELPNSKMEKNLENCFSLMSGVLGPW